MCVTLDWRRVAVLPRCMHTRVCCGSQVIPGYADAHTPAKLEVPVKLAYSQQAEVEGKARTVMSRL